METLKAENSFFTGIVNLILFFLFSIVFLLTFNGYMTADIADVNAVVELADGSVAAKTKLKLLLAENPTPTNRQLSRIKREINEVLVLDKTKQVTGNPELGEAQPSQLEEGKQEPPNLENLNTFEAILIAVSFFLLVLLTLLMVVKHFFHSPSHSNLY